MRTIIIIVCACAIYYLIRVIFKKRNIDGSLNKPVSFNFVKSEIGSRELIKCHKCGKESNNLNWYKFSSSFGSWRKLIGRAGFYSKCPDCDIMVDEIITVRN